jgi:hypothetical protein
VETFQQSVLFFFRAVRLNLDRALMRDFGTQHLANQESFLLDAEFA